MPALTLLLAAASLFATDAADALEGVASSGAKTATIAAAVIIAYRVTSSAHRDSVSLYKEAAADADARLDRERQLHAMQRDQWSRERDALAAEIDRLRCDH